MVYNLVSQRKNIYNKDTIKIYILLTLCDKEVEHGEDDSVATEHVVTTGMHSGQGHPKTTPDGHSPLQFGPHVTIHLGRRE